MLDWPALERSAKLVAGPGPRMDGRKLLRLRGSLLEMVEEASAEVEKESGMSAFPAAELLVVDRHGWIGGNIRSLERMFGDVEVKGGDNKLVAWEGGGFLGLVARMVLGQYDPFRDQLLVVYPNLGEFSDQDGMRFLLFHEVTHVAQFRSAPWIADRIVESAKKLLTMQQAGFGREVIRQLPERLPEIIKWARDVMEGKPTTSTPIFDLLPAEQREALQRVNALVTLLEGHATHVTDLIAKRVLPTHEAIEKRMAERRKRPPIMRLLEALGGIDMKRQQYVLGRAFCETVWNVGGTELLSRAFASPDAVPTPDELQDPHVWIARMGSTSQRPA